MALLQKEFHNGVLRFNKLKIRYKATNLIFISSFPFSKSINENTKFVMEKAIKSITYSREAINPFRDLLSC